MFDAEDSNGRSCVLFFTSVRIIVVPRERFSWAGFLVMIGIIVGFAVLFVRSAVTFIAGMGIAVGVGVLFGLVGPFIRRLSVSRLKRLDADEISKASKKNFEVPYSGVVGVRKRQIKTCFGAGLVWYMTPRPVEVRYHDIIEILTTQERYSFVLSHKELDRCMDLIHEALPCKIT